MADYRLPEKLAAARLRAVNKMPYFAQMIYSLVPVETTRLPTMAVDATWRLFYNPNFVEAHTVPELAGVLYHELMHLFRAHHKRCRDGNRDWKLWNFATDFAINDDAVELAKQGYFELPKDLLLPDAFGLQANGLEEDYYALLLEVEAQVRPEIEKLFREGIVMPGCGRGGSCATGHNEDWEPDSGSSPPGVSATIQDLVRGKVAQEMIDHASRHPGSVPGGMLRSANEILHPKVPWRTKLRNYIRTAVLKVTGAMDYDRTKPRRRADQSSVFILPGMKGGVCRVCVVIDTSGSMSDHQLSLALAEVRGILEALQNSIIVTVLSVDAAVGKVQKILNPRKIELIGGGGTDMAQGIIAAAESKPRPDVVVVLTDGFTGWPLLPPPGVKKVIAVILRGENSAPEWADSCVVD